MRCRIRGRISAATLLACALEGTDPKEHPLRHVADLAPRQGRLQQWPQWADPDVVRAFHDRGIEAMWSHQLAAANLAHDGRHVVLSTGTASGKSLAYQLPILTALKANSRARALYLSPTKALGHDQLRAAIALTEAVPGLGDVAPSSYDGDSPGEVRRFARERSRWIFSNPDMIHLSLLRNHARWAVFLRNLQFIVVDECHYYRGVFGSNVAIDPASPAAVVCPVHGQLGNADGHLRKCDHGAARGDRLGAHRPDGGGGDRGRLAAGRAHRGAVGAGTARGHRRRKRRAGAAFGRRRGRTGDGRPHRRGRANADLRAVAPRRRADRARCAGTTRRHRSGPCRACCVLPGGLSGRGPPGTGTRSGRRRIAGHGHHQRAGVGRGHRGTGCGGAGRLSRHGHVVLAAGGPFGPTRAERADRADRP